MLALSLQRDYRQAADSRLEVVTLAALVLQTMLLSSSPVMELRSLWLTALLWLLAPVLAAAVVVWQCAQRVTRWRASHLAAKQQPEDSGDQLILPPEDATLRM